MSGCLVGRVGVENQVDLETGRDFLVELGQELPELHGPVAAVQGADHLTRGDLKSGEESRCAGPAAVVAAAFRTPGTIGNTGWDRSRAWICDFSSTQDQGLLRRVETEADDVTPCR